MITAAAKILGIANKICDNIALGRGAVMLSNCKVLSAEITTGNNYEYIDDIANQARQFHFPQQPLPGQTRLTKPVGPSGRKPAS